MSVFLVRLGRVRLHIHLHLRTSRGLWAVKRTHGSSFGILFKNIAAVTHESPPPWPGRTVERRLVVSVEPPVSAGLSVTFTSQLHLSLPTTTPSIHFLGRPPRPVPYSSVTGHDAEFSSHKSSRNVAVPTPQFLLKGSERLPRTGSGSCPFRHTLIWWQKPWPSLYFLQVVDLVPDHGHQPCKLIPQ